MEPVRVFLDDLKRQGLERGHTLGLLHLLVGRRVSGADGALVTQGLTWRELAALLKKTRWDKEAVRELGLDPKAMPPRDRQQYWYFAISQAHLDSPAAKQAGEALAALLEPLGYRLQ